jgi:hypothetical protein
VEDRIECSASGQVQYKTRNEYFLPFNIPLAAATNLKVSWYPLSSWLRTLFWPI